MKKIKFCLFLMLVFLSKTLLFSAINADYGKLEKLFDNEKYEDCIDKATDMAKENPKDAEPIYWAFKSAVQISLNPESSEKYGKTSVKKAINFGLKLKKKDKDLIFFPLINEDLSDLKKSVFEKVKELEKKNDDPKIIDLYTTFYELTEDNETQFLLSELYDKKGMYTESFELLTKVVVKSWKEFREKKPVMKSAYPFAKMAKHFFDMNNISQAKGVFNKGFIIYKNDKDLRDELNRQITYKSFQLKENDVLESLNRIQEELNWADSIAPNLPAMKEVQELADYAFIKYYVCFEQDKKENLIAYFRKTNIPKPDVYLLNLSSDKSVRRVEGTKEYLYNMVYYFGCELSSEMNCVKKTCDEAINEKLFKQAIDYITQLEKIKKITIANKEEIKNGLIQNLSNSIMELPDNKEFFRYIHFIMDIEPNNKKLKNTYQTKLKIILEKMVKEENFKDYFYNRNEFLESIYNDKSIAEIDKKMVLADYEKNFKPHLLRDNKSMGVVSHVPSCSPGKVNDSAQKIFTEYLSYIRRLSGISDTVILIEKYNKLAQAAALMMTANGTLDHNPPKTWKCYSEDGKAGANGSNLSLGAIGTRGLYIQLDDGGISTVGHRRWILNPTQKVFGHGSAETGMALYVFGYEPKIGGAEWDKNKFIAWPAAGHCPKEFLFSNWSFGLSGANFNAANVEMKVNNKKINIEKYKPQGGFGINTFVWNVGNYEQKSGDVIEIKITQVSFGSVEDLKTYTYKVIVVE